MIRTGVAHSRRPAHRRRTPTTAAIAARTAAPSAAVARARDTPERRSAVAAISVVAATRSAAELMRSNWGAPTLPGARRGDSGLAWRVDRRAGAAGRARVIDGRARPARPSAAGSRAADEAGVDAGDAKARGPGACEGAPVLAAERPGARLTSVRGVAPPSRGAAPAPVGRVAFAAGRSAAGASTSGSRAGSTAAGRSGPAAGALDAGASWAAGAAEGAG
jgi:hypothetical protein